MATSNTTPNKPQGVNSSPWYQEPGSSLNKYVQGVIANTNIDIANSDLAHCCDVTIDGKFIIFGTTFQARSLIETTRAAELSAWITESISPVIETVKKVIDAINFVVNEIKKAVDFIKYIITEVQQLIQAIQQLIDFILSLPEKLLEVVKNCLVSAQGLLSQTIQLTVDAVNTSIANTTTQTS
jgi:phage-related protein